MKRKQQAKVNRNSDGEITHLDRKSEPINTEPDWTKSCEVCGATPIHPITGMCGPCTFGEAETIGGNW